MNSVLAAWTVLALQAPTRDAPAALEPRVNAAIEKGVAWLKKEQQPDGTWAHGNNDRFAAGVAALGFLTLIKSGVPESDPAMQRSLRYFDAYRPFEKTYSTGVLMVAWEAFKRGKQDVPKLEAGAKWLMEHRDKTTKLWAYPDGAVDLSNTQYALLGLYAASRAGVKIPKDFLWETIQAVAKRHQERQGGSFTYADPEGLGIGSMTVAAITDLRIAAAELKGFAPYEAKRQELDAIEKSAFAWLERNYRVDGNPANNTGRGYQRPWHHYYLYGLERACALAGRAKIGTHAWYPEGAEYLLATQDEDGRWEGDFVKTCFALLFLKRATLTWSNDPRGAGAEVVAAPAPVRRRPPEPKPTAAYLKHWLVAGPFATKRNDPLSKDEIGETALKSAREGENAGSSPKKWIAAEATDQWMLELSGGKSVLPAFDVAFAYAWTTVRAAKDQDAILWIGHDDGARVWLNGKLVYEGETYNEATGRDTYYATVRLKAGVNTVLAKVVNFGYGCGLSMRFATPSGDALE